MKIFPAHMIKDKSILIKNIFYMLAYYYMPLSQSGYTDVAAEHFENIHNLLAAILAKGINRQIKRGLCREYVNRVDGSSALRGKINMPGSIQSIIMREKRLVCEYDELTTNCLFNRILKSSTLLLVRHAGVDCQWKTALNRALRYMAAVENIDLRAISWPRLQYYRNNADYRMLMGVCQLLAEGLILTTEAGGYRLASFLKPDKIHILFEKFLLAYYVKEHPELHSESRQIPWVVDDGYMDMLPSMHSDITLSDKKSGRILIIDAKYYDKTMQTYFKSKSLRSAHLYQIFAYVKNMAYIAGTDKKVAGMTFYAHTDEDIQPNNFYRLSGNEISFCTLNLNLDFAKIRNQLDKIAESLITGVPLETNPDMVA